MQKVKSGFEEQVGVCYKYITEGRVDLRTLTVCSRVARGSGKWQVAEDSTATMTLNSDLHCDSSGHFTSSLLNY